MYVKRERESSCLQFVKRKVLHQHEIAERLVTFQCSWLKIIIALSLSVSKCLQEARYSEKVSARRSLFAECNNRQ